MATFSTLGYYGLLEADATIVVTCCNYKRVALGVRRPWRRAGWVGGETSLFPSQILRTSELQGGGVGSTVFHGGRRTYTKWR